MLQRDREIYTWMALLTSETCTVGHLLSRATNFANGAGKGVRGVYFYETTLAELFTIHVNLRTCD